MSPSPAVVGPKDHGGGRSVAAQRMPSLTEGLLGQSAKAPGLPVDIVSKAAKIAGPPPKVRAPILAMPSPGHLPHADASLSGGQDPVLLALTQQSTAISSLVSHLAAGDSMVELGSGAASSSSSSTKGVQRRERLQSKRMHPARPQPKSLVELQGSGLSMFQYLERFGGYRNQKGAGLTLWLLGHVVDSMLEENYRGS